MSDDNSSLIDKVLIAYVNGVAKLIDTVEEKFDIDLAQKMNALEEKNIEFQREHPVLNIGKQLVKGTVRGLLGNYMFKK